ncbi:hypothetical protein F5883DRAFT_635880 [Diaporthe sp. PMI_573]|nr:hypothetical protein F5883DRAFT_635880 [Diaporthaceae sp. PMI_573]
MASVPATAFPRFLDLPFEIRWEIYNLCLPTRVVDSAIVPDLITPSMPCYLPYRKQAPAFRYIVAKYSRMPAVCRAIPEVYRKLRQHMVPPPANEWAWTWDNDGDGPKVIYQDPRPILFNPKSDVVYISPRDYDSFNDPQMISRSPCWLARNPDAVVAIDEWFIQTLGSETSIANYCFLGRKNCTIILSETRLVKPMKSITSSGLFGLFGEERTVLVDVDDLDRIDYFDKKLNGQDIHPRKWLEDPVMPGGVRRYSSHGTVDFRRAWDEDSPVVSAEERSQLIAKDKNEMLRRVKLAWLKTNGCWAEPSTTDPYFLPFKRCRHSPPGWDLLFDEEHPTAKLWLDKLPAFSFAVRVLAQDLEECSRLWGAELTWNGYSTY